MALATIGRIPIPLGPAAVISYCGCTGGWEVRPPVHVCERSRPLWEFVQFVWYTATAHRGDACLCVASCHWRNLPLMTPLWLRVHLAPSSAAEPSTKREARNNRQMSRITVGGSFFLQAYITFLFWYQAQNTFSATQKENEKHEWMCLCSRMETERLSVPGAKHQLGKSPGNFHPNLFFS